MGIDISGVEGITSVRWWQQASRTAVYIQNQEKEDMITIQISMVEYYDPFKEWMESYRNGKVNKK